MSENLKIFLGADKNGADNEELKKLWQQAMKEDYHGYRNFTVATNMLKQLPNIEKKSVVIRGGSVEACVVLLIKNLKQLGIKEIEVDFINCRIDGGDQTNNKKMVARRREMFYTRLKELEN